MAHQQNDIANLQQRVQRLENDNTELKTIITMLVELLPLDQRIKIKSMPIMSQQSTSTTTVSSNGVLGASAPTMPLPTSSSSNYTTSTNNYTTSNVPPPPMNKSLSTTPPPYNIPTQQHQQPPPQPTIPSPSPSTYNSFNSTTSSPSPSSSPYPQLNKSLSSTPPPSFQSTTGSYVQPTPTASSLPSLTPIKFVNTQQGFVIYGTTYPQNACNDLQLLIQGKTPSFTSITLRTLVDYLKQFKDREREREKSFYGKTLQLLRHLDLDGPLVSNLIIPCSYFPLDINNINNNSIIYDATTSSGHIYSPIEYLRFLTCVAHSLPYTDSQDVLYNIFYYWGLPILTPIAFQSSLTYTKYLDTHSGFYKDTKTHNKPGSFTLLYVSNTSDCDITFWFHLIGQNSLLSHIISTSTQTNGIYADSYITMPYFRTLLGLTESISYMAQCYNTINMNANHRNKADMFAQFFALANSTYKQPTSFDQLYEFLWVISFYLNQFTSNAPVSYVTTTSNTCIHWIMKTLSSSQNGTELLSTLTQALVSTEFFYISFGTTTMTPSITTTLSQHFRDYKTVGEKVAAKKALTSSDLMLINNQKMKLSVQLRDIFSGSSTTLVNNYIQNTKSSNTQWLKDLVSIVKNA